MWAPHERRIEFGYLGFGLSAIDHHILGESLADWRQGKAGYHCVPVRLFVLFAHGAVHGSGGSEAVDRARCGECEQCDRLRHRDADGAAWVYSGELVLYRRVCGEYPVVGEGGREFLVQSFPRSQKRDPGHPGSCFPISWRDGTAP